MEIKIYEELWDTLTPKLKKILKIEKDHFGYNKYKE